MTAGERWRGADRRRAPAGDDLLRDAANWGARRFKGGAYQIDPAVPASALAGYGVRRASALARGALRSVLLARGSDHLTFLGRDVEIRNGRFVRLGRGVTIGAGSVLDGLSRTGLTLGPNVTLGAHTTIELTGVITDLGEGCRIGARSSLGSFSFVGAAGGVWIGDDVIMGNRVSFHAENHRFDDPARPIREQGVTREGIVVEDDCWVGANATFLDGAHVRRGSVIGAGSVVRGEIPAFSVAVGSPAVVVRRRDG